MTGVESQREIEAGGRALPSQGAITTTPTGCLSGGGQAMGTSSMLDGDRVLRDLEARHRAAKPQPWVKGSEKTEYWLDVWGRLAVARQTLQMKGFEAADGQIQDLEQQITGFGGLD